MIVNIIDVPIDLGADERGVSLGPTAIRMAGLEDKLQTLGFKIAEEPTYPLFIPRRHAELGQQDTKYLSSILEISLSLREKVYRSKKNGEFPIILGGDHSLALGSISGLSQYYLEKNQSLGVIWIDAHGDYNTPQTTPSGNLHGMPLAILNGLGDERFSQLVQPGKPVLEATKTVLFAIRDLDPGEKELIKSQPVTAITMMQVDQMGIDASLKIALQRLHTCDAIHVSFDIDSLDPSIAPGVGTPVLGGLTYREAHYIMETLSENKKVGSLDLVEVNPLLDHKNQTAKMAVELLGSLLGSRIL